MDGVVQAFRPLPPVRDPDSHEIIGFLTCSEMAEYEWIEIPDGSGYLRKYHTYIWSRITGDHAAGGVSAVQFSRMKPPSKVTRYWSANQFDVNSDFQINPGLIGGECS
jgi:hypothetical protein